MHNIIAKYQIAIKIACLAGLGIVFAFFVSATLLMTMTGEDILHKNSTLDVGSLDTIRWIYQFTPRIGEFLQRLAIQLYEYQVSGVSLGTGLRLVDALLCFMLIYAISCVCIGRKLRLSFKDTLLFLSVFLLFVISRHNEVFIMRFSYLHNYVPMLMLLAIAAYIIFYGRSKSKYLMPAIGFIIGLLLGASSEITPIAYMIIVCCYVFYRKFRGKESIIDIIKSHSTRATLTLGVAIGLVFIITSGSIEGRADSGYGQLYDYVSVSDLINNTIYTAAKLTEHFIFNARYLMLPIVAMIMFAMTEFYLKKSGRVRSGKFINIQVVSLSFVILYMLASSQIRVLDDLYPRFMSPVFVVVIISLVSFASHIIDLIKPRQRQMAIAYAACLFVSCIALVDLTYGFVNANQAYDSKLEQVKNSPSSKVCVVKDEVERKYYSPLFKFTSYPPFEEWTDDFGNDRIYRKDLIYSESCSKPKQLPL